MAAAVSVLTILAIPVFAGRPARINNTPIPAIYSVSSVGFALTADNEAAHVSADYRKELADVSLPSSADTFALGPRDRLIVPEPTSILLVGGALIGVGIVRKKAKSKRED